ncbi:hypothetical protein Btru_015173 [Bulinus truncatus]|nr:hypothetical protein Btru_015173 [Bulinus truncatus]
MIGPTITKIGPALRKFGPAITKISPAIAKISPAIAKIGPAIQSSAVLCPASGFDDPTQPPLLDCNARQMIMFDLISE